MKKDRLLDGEFDRMDGTDPDETASPDDPLDPVPEPKRDPEPPPVVRSKAGGPLKFDQLRALVGQGLSIQEVRELNASGFNYEQIKGLAEAQVLAKQVADTHTAQAMRSGMSEAIADNKPRRTSRDDAEYELKSAYNPRGDRDYPRPGLKCRMFWGVIAKDPSQQPATLYEIEAESCTYDEQLILNRLEPIATTFERNDGLTEPIHIVPTHDLMTKDVTRLVIAIRRDMYERQLRSQLPSLRSLAQLVVSMAALSER